MPVVQKLLLHNLHQCCCSNQCKPPAPNLGRPTRGHFAKSLLWGKLDKQRRRQSRGILLFVSFRTRLKFGFKEVLQEAQGSCWVVFCD